MATLQRSFRVQASREALFRVADTPLFAPAYLNFLKAIALIDPTPEAPVGAQTYRVLVVYKKLIRATAYVDHRADADTHSVYLSHDGPLASFDASYHITDGQVLLNCSYDAKAPLVRILIGAALDRVLSQVASAMDRYAASWTPSPT